MVSCSVALLHAIEDAVKLACMLDLNACSAMELLAAALQHQDQPRADVMILMVEEAKKMHSRAADTIQAALDHELGQSTNGKQKQCSPQPQCRLVLQPASLIGFAIRSLVHIN